MSEYPYDETDLDNWTEDYWRLSKEARYDHYLGPEGYGDSPKPLLQIELECAEQMGQLPKRREKTTLVLLVGTSFEPLLQAICAYQPDRLVPVVSHFYDDRGDLGDGRLHWQELRNLIERIPKDLVSLPEIPTIQETVTDDPQAVFDHLRAKLRDDLASSERRVVIDITGAKKTMVAGAYLLAVYARARISYVDFKWWNDEQRRPYGYSCHIRDNVPNPLREWALQDWERVKEQYDKYNFAAAIEAIPEKGPAALTAASAKLKGFLEVCAAWEAGDLAKAKELADKLSSEWQPHVPLAVRELGGLWPRSGEERKDRLKTEFLLNPRALVIYAEDECARARRLAGRETRPDNRAAFVRAYAVHETLIKTRVLILLERGEITLDPTKTKDKVQRAMLYEMTSGAAK